MIDLTDFWNRRRRTRVFHLLACGIDQAAAERISAAEMADRQRVGLVIGDEAAAKCRVEHEDRADGPTIFHLRIDPADVPPDRRKAAKALSRRDLGR